MLINTTFSNPCGLDIYDEGNNLRYFNGYGLSKDNLVSQKQKYLKANPEDLTLSGFVRKQPVKIKIDYEEEFRNNKSE